METNLIHQTLKPNQRNIEFIGKTFFKLCLELVESLLHHCECPKRCVHLREPGIDQECEW